MIENCESPKINLVKRLLAYFNKHYHQATIIVFALSLGFVIAVTFVGYAVFLQAKNGCLTLFSSIKNDSDNK